MKTLKQRMIDQMELRNFSPKTQRAYLGAIKGLAAHYKHPPEQLSNEQVLDYVLFLKNVKGLAPSSCNVTICACRFVYCTVLKTTEEGSLSFPLQKTPKRLPTVMSLEEVQALLMATTNPKHRTFLMLLYGTGLRLSEAVNLRVSDINSKQMVVRVREGKGKKERNTILSESLLEELRSYFGSYQPKEWLFYGRSKDAPLPSNSGQKIFYHAKRRAGLKKEGGVHTLRHSFATHMLDAGVDLKTIQSMMGHSSLTTTMIYLHVSTRHINKVKSPLDSMNFRSADPFSQEEG